MNGCVVVQVHACFVMLHLISRSASFMHVHKAEIHPGLSPHSHGSYVICDQFLFYTTKLVMPEHVHSVSKAICDR